MPVNTAEKISECTARIMDLRRRAEDDPAAKAELSYLESQWQSVLESYTLVEQAANFLDEFRARRFAPNGGPALRTVSSKRSPP